jgi:hypothetical protein
MLHRDQEITVYANGAVVLAPSFLMIKILLKSHFRRSSETAPTMMPLQNVGIFCGGMEEVIAEPSEALPQANA